MIVNNTPDASLHSQSEEERRKEKSSGSSSSLSSLWWKHLRKKILIPLVATINTPPYTMVICISIFLSAVYRWKDDRIARTLLALYFVYCMGDPTPKNISKPLLVKLFQKWCNDSWFFRWTAEYFPCHLHRTCDQSSFSKTSGGPYIFVYHPHGVIGMGVNMALNTNACNFDTLFPEVTGGRSAVTLNVSFWVPFFRDWILLNGFCSANKQTLVGRLTAGESLVLVPGGAREGLLAHPKTMRLAVKRRKGFVKLAVETNATLVPVLGFGENDVFDTATNTHITTTRTNDDSCAESKKPSNYKRWISKLQHWFMNITSFSIPIWTNMIPNRTPIHVVVGKPIQFQKKNTTNNNANNNFENGDRSNGQQQEKLLLQRRFVDECLAQYIQALRELYEEQKHKYGYENVPLEIL